MPDSSAETVTEPATTATSSAGTAPAKKAPAKKAAVEKAPVKKAPAKKAPVKKAPVKKAPAKRVPAKAVVAPEPPLKEPVDLIPGLEPELPPQARDRAGWPPRVLVLSLVLVAAAVAMGVAALLMRGAETWSATSRVRLVSAGDAAAPPTGAQVSEVRDAVHLLTGPASRLAGVPDLDVRADLSAHRQGSDQLTLTAHASSPAEAERLAAAAASVLALGPERVGTHSVLLAEPASAHRTSPSLRTALTTGALAGLGLLLLVGARIVLGGRSAASRRR